MKLSLEERVAALEAMSTTQLRQEWQRVYREPFPPFTPDLLARGIAYRLQERVHGGLSASTRREIARLLKRYRKTGEVIRDPCAFTKPGTHLVREWQGEQHHVLILDCGYLYRDRRYSSLTQIARDITGVHWSGPRFFGLTHGQDRRRKKRNAEI